MKFTWYGKENAIIESMTPSTGTLRPDKDSSKNWDDTENLYIEGDNLEVLKLLQKSYFGKIKMIYIDPPYNTGKDFIYKDNFRDNIANYKEITNQSTKANPETNGRYHTDWLNMMYPRLKLARNLLTDDGAIFISISNEEYANLKKICDEIFGENNYIETFLWTKTSTPPSLSNKSRKTVEYIICYEKFRNSNKYKGELLENGDAPLLNSGNKSTILKFPSNTIKFKIKDGLYKKGKYDKVELLNDIDVENGENRQEVTLKGKFVWTQDTLNEELKKGTYFLIKSEKLSIRFQRLFNDYIYKTPTNFISEKNMNIDLNNKSNIGTNETANKELIDINMDKIFDYAKPTSLIKYISQFIVDKSDIILDFFSGSATTAHSVIQLNLENKSKNKFIMVQLPELTEEKSEAYKSGYKNICEIGKERIRRAGEKIVSENKDKEGIEKLDIGFKVFKLEYNCGGEKYSMMDEGIKVDIIKRPKDKPICKFKIYGELYYLVKTNEDIIVFPYKSTLKGKAIASIFNIELCKDKDYMQLEYLYNIKLNEFNGEDFIHSQYVTSVILDNVYKNLND